MVWSSSARASGAEKVKRIEIAFAAVRKGTATAVLNGDLYTVTSSDGTILFNENISEARKVDLAKRSAQKVETVEDTPKSYGASSDSDLKSETVSAPVRNRKK